MKINNKVLVYSRKSVYICNIKSEEKTNEMGNLTINILTHEAVDYYEPYSNRDGSFRIFKLPVGGKTYSIPTNFIRGYGLRRDGIVVFTIRHTFTDGVSSQIDTYDIYGKHSGYIPNPEFFEDVEVISWEQMAVPQVPEKVKEKWTREDFVQCLLENADIRVNDDNIEYWAERYGVEII